MQAFVQHTIGEAKVSMAATFDDRDVVVSLNINECDHVDNSNPFEDEEEMPEEEDANTGMVAHAAEMAFDPPALTSYLPASPNAPSRARHPVSALERHAASFSSTPAPERPAPPLKKARIWVRTHGTSLCGWLHTVRLNQMPHWVKNPGLRPHGSASLTYLIHMMLLHIRQRTQV